MLEVLPKALGLIFIVVLGYTLKRVGFFKPHDYKLVAKIALNITLPGTVIASFSSFSFDPALIWIVLLGFGGNLLMTGIGAIVARNREKVDRAFFMLNLSGYNIGCFTLPLVQSFLGAYGVVVTCMFDAGNSIMCTGGTYAIAQSALGGEKKRGIGDFCKTLFSSVPFDVYVIMLLLSMLNLRLPEFGVTIAANIGAANAFVAMLMIGMMFELKFDQQYLKDAATALILRYGMAAVFASLIYYLAPFPLEARQVLVILVFGPIAAMVPVFTEKCKGNVALSGMINSFSIVISTVVIIMLLTAMRIG